MDEQWILGYLFSVFSKIEKKIQTFEWKKISMHTLIPHRKLSWQKFHSYVIRLTFEFT